MPQISLASNDRVFICGKTGSGKTYLSHYLTKKIKRLVVLDGKGTLANWNCDEWDASKDLGDPSASFRLRAVPGIKVDLAEYWDSVLERCMRAGNVTVYIDELYAVCPPNKAPSPTLFACYTRGREFGLGMWASTQRPVWIPLVAMSEAEHFFVFRLQLWEDKQRLAAFMGQEVLQPVIDEHGFYYMRAVDDQVTYYKRFNPIQPTDEEPEATVTKKQIPRSEMPLSKDNRERHIHLFGVKNS